MTRVQLSSLRIGKRHRALDRSKVKTLAQSMEAIGLQHPISVHAGDGDTMHLVAGLHRVEAAKLLGWEHIDGIIVELSDHDRELWEIDENLMRAELSTDEKRKHLRRRKELWEKRPVVAHDAPKLVSKRGRVGEGRPKSFAADTAAATGLSKSQINRLIAEPKPPTKLANGEGSDDLDLPDFLDRRGKKDEAKATMVTSAKKVDGPKPKETFGPPRKTKPKLEKHIGLDAARRYYLEQCEKESDVDLGAEQDTIIAALREIVRKRGQMVAAETSCTAGMEGTA